MGQYAKPLSLRGVQIDDRFWKEKLELVRNEVIPYQWDALNDRVKGAAPSFCMRNFKVAGKITRERRKQGEKYQEKIWPLDTFETLPSDMEHMDDRFYGFLFQDSDFSKWIEAVAYSLTQHPDEELERIADDAIDIVCEAQQDNGYLDTYYIINDISKIFTNLRDNHELYCFGHLTEGAVAYYQATGKDKLLNAARRFADYIYDCFGKEDGKRKGYPGHEIAEMALMRLYDVTGDEKYRELSEFFINQRGTRPYYFDSEHPETVKKGHEDELRHSYNQAHLPVREQDEAVGHSVRAVYLYSGMADVAMADSDETLYNACLKLWDNITQKKMYVTGGIGATHMGEAFSFNYDLPNDTAYSETCAAIGLVFFARRMLQIKADRRFADVMERALYNTVLAGMAADGKSFFYVNPLEVYPKACHEDARKFHVKPVRQKWFGCACCPPNIARLLSSLSMYAYTENDDTLFAHLFVGGNVRKYIGQTGECADGEGSGKENVGCLSFYVTTDMPWQGTTVYSCTNENPVRGTLAVRIPDWSESFTVSGVSGNLNEDTAKLKDGYLYITREWKKGDELKLELSMKTEFIAANTQVREDINKTALRRGPFIYCLEETDNGAELHRLSVCVNAKPEEIILNIAGTDAVALRIAGKRLVDTSDNASGGDEAGSVKASCEIKEPLYSTLRKPQYEDVKLTYVPYYEWNNRGEGEMSVWVNYTFD